MRAVPLVVRTLALAALAGAAPLADASRGLEAQAVAPAGATRQARATMAPVVRSAFVPALDTSRARSPMTVGVARAAGALLGAGLGAAVLAGVGAACDAKHDDSCMTGAIVGASAAMALMVSEVTASAGPRRAIVMTLAGALAGGVMTARAASQGDGYGALVVAGTIPLGAVLGNIAGQYVPLP